VDLQHPSPERNYINSEWRSNFHPRFLEESLLSLPSLLPLSISSAGHCIAVYIVGELNMIDSYKKWCINMLNKVVHKGGRNIILKMLLYVMRKETEVSK
jgi:hypothetical protein